MNFKPHKKLNPKRTGRVVFHNFDLNILFDNLNRDLLYLRFFGARKSNSLKYCELETEFERIKSEIIENKYIIPKGIYAVCRAVSYKNKIKVMCENNEFEINLSLNRDGISISNFLFEDDFIALTSSSCFVDNEVLYRYIETDDFKKLYFINSINIMLAEAFTEVLHYLASKDAGLNPEFDMRKLYTHKNYGLRYSPGYPGIEITENRTIHLILRASDIGSSVTESGMIDPQSSVQSLIVFNEKAFYL